MSGVSFNNINEEYRWEASILPVRFLIGLVKAETAFPHIILIIITLNCNLETLNVLMSLF